MYCALIGRLALADFGVTTLPLFSGCHFPQMSATHNLLRSPNGLIFFSACAQGGRGATRDADSRAVRPVYRRADESLAAADEGFSRDSWLPRPLCAER